MPLFSITTTDGRRWSALSPREADAIKRQLIAEGMCWWDMEIKREEVEEKAA